VAGSRKVFSTIASLLIKYVIEIEWQEATRKEKEEPYKNMELLNCETIGTKRYELESKRKKSGGISASVPRHPKT
jgi:hypothetical protein